RRWSENLADVAIALMTLAVTAAFMLGFNYPSWISGFPSILNRAVFGLALMTGVWHWLMGVWKQQLDDGKPWTTAGRLIRCLRRVGFLVGCTAALMSLHLSFWPSLPEVIERDNSTLRWIGALAANGLLLGALLFS